MSRRSCDLRARGNPSRSDGQCEGAITPDGAHVAYASSASGIWQATLWDRTSGATTPISTSVACAAGNADSLRLSLSDDDGRLVAFTSAATNLLATAVTGTHAFLRDVTTGTTTLVDRFPTGTVGNGTVDDVAISGNGTHVAIISLANNLTPAKVTSPLPQLYVRTLTTGSIRPVTLGRVGGVRVPVHGSAREPDRRAPGMPGPPELTLPALASGYSTERFMVDSSVRADRPAERLTLCRGARVWTSADLR
jgi:hypothetical protein